MRHNVYSALRGTPDLVLERGASVSGRVEDSRGTPWVGAIVEVRPVETKGATLRVLPQVDGYEQKWQRHKPQGNVLDLPLEQAMQSVTRLTGSIVPPPPNWKELRILLDGQPSEGKVDELGRFGFDVNGKDGDRIRLKVYADGRLIYDDYQILPGPLMFRLHTPAE